jgi:peptidoglycan/LPS O-acetylase OafA/YrhL
MGVLAWTAAALLMCQLLFVASAGPGLFLGMYAMAAISTAGLIAGLMGGYVPLLKAVLGCGPMRWVGKISYGLYLYHVPIYGLFPWSWVSWASPELAPYLGMAAEMAITFSVASLSYYMVERPMMGLRHRFGSTTLDPEQLKAALLGKSPRLSWGLRGAVHS